MMVSKAHAEYECGGKEISSVPLLPPEGRQVQDERKEEEVVPGAEEGAAEPELIGKKKGEEGEEEAPVEKPGKPAAEEGKKEAKKEPKKD